MESQLLSKLYDMGVLNTTAKLSEIENKLTVAAFCRRRLGVVMHRLNMAESVSAVSSKGVLVGPLLVGGLRLVELHCLEEAPDRGTESDHFPFPGCQVY